MPTFSTAGACAMMAAVFAAMIELVGSLYAVAEMAAVPPPPMHAINRGLYSQQMKIWFDSLNDICGKQIAKKCKCRTKCNHDDDNDDNDTFDDDEYYDDDDDVHYDDGDDYGVHGNVMVMETIMMMMKSMPMIIIIMLMGMFINIWLVWRWWWRIQMRWWLWWRWWWLWWCWWRWWWWRWWRSCWW